MNSTVIDKTALVIGASGFIGHSLFNDLNKYYSYVFGTYRKNCVDSLIKLDLSVPFENNQTFIKQINRLGTSLNTVYLCAAVSRFVECNSDPIKSYLINVTNTEYLAKYFLERGVNVVYFSSNAIFEGNKQFCDEMTVALPKTEYGRQKYAAESKLLDLHHLTKKNGPFVKIIRITKVLASDTPLIVSWLKAFINSQPILAFENAYFSPISLPYLFSAVQEIVKDPISGVYHLSGQADISYYNFAIKLAISWGFDPMLVTPIPAPLNEGGIYSYGALKMQRTSIKIGVLPENIDEVIKDLA